MNDAHSLTYGHQKRNNTMNMQYTTSPDYLLDVDASISNRRGFILSCVEFGNEDYKELCLCHERFMLHLQCNDNSEVPESYRYQAADGTDAEQVRWMPYRMWLQCVSESDLHFELSKCVNKMLGRKQYPPTKSLANDVFLPTHPMTRLLMSIKPFHHTLKSFDESNKYSLPNQLATVSNNLNR